MTSSDWTVLAAVAMPVVVAMAPWMFMVHAKLAVIAAKVSDLCETIKHDHEEQIRLVAVQHRHATRLDNLERAVFQKSEIQMSKSETNPNDQMT